MKRKLRYGVSFAIVAGALAVASIAWACTPQNGITFITTPDCVRNPCTIARGNNIMTHARYMVQDNLNYDLWLSVEPWCHNSTSNKKLSGPHKVDILGEIKGLVDYDLVTDGDGALYGDIVGPIPAKSQVSRGDYDVCFNSGGGNDNTQSSYSSSPVTLTLT